MSSEHQAQVSQFQRLLAYVKPFKGAFVVAILAMIGYAAIDSLFVASVKPLIDEGLTNKDTSVLAVAPFFVLGAFLFRGLCSFTSKYVLTWIGSKIVMQLRQQLFDKYLALPVSYFDQQSAGRLISRITYDTTMLQTACSDALVIMVREGAFVIGLLCLMFYQSWELSLIFLVIGPVVAFAVTKVSRRFRKVAKNLQHSQGELTTATEQSITGHKVILMFGGQSLESDRFEGVTNRARQQYMKMESTHAASVPAIQIIASFALVAVLLVASTPAMLDKLTPGTFTVVITSMIMLLRPLKSLTQVNGHFQKGMTAAQTLFEVLDLPSEKDTGTHQVERVKGALSVDRLTFYYDGKEQPALDDISFEVRPGETIALVGRSGSGKSTITNLLTRFYEWQQGEIRLDGVALQDYTLSCLREQFALVSQHVTLFNDSIANNIAYAMKGEVSREQIEQAARTAHAMEFIEKMPEGLDTVIGENGVMLSGGQRQRIAIARALLRNAPILILDEATSALDTESERHIQAALDELQQNRTSIVVAHRLSTIEKADKILVMDAGQIVEHGSHQALLEQGGLYAQLHRMQYGL